MIFTVAPLIFPVQEVSSSSSRQHGGQNICEMCAGPYGPGKSTAGFIQWQQAEKQQMYRTSSARGSVYLLDRENEWCYSVLYS